MNSKLKTGIVIGYVSVIMILSAFPIISDSAKGGGTYYNQTSGTINYANWVITFNMKSTSYGGIHISKADFDTTDINVPLAPNTMYRIFSNAWNPPLQVCNLNTKVPLDSAHLIEDNCWYFTGDISGGGDYIKIHGEWEFSTPEDSWDLHVIVEWFFSMYGETAHWLQVTATSGGKPHVDAGVEADIELELYSVLDDFEYGHPTDDNNMYIWKNQQGGVPAWEGPQTTEISVSDYDPYFLMGITMPRVIDLLAKIVYVDDYGLPDGTSELKCYVGHARPTQAYPYHLWPSMRYLPMYQTDDQEADKTKAPVDHCNGEAIGFDPATQEAHDSAQGYWAYYDDIPNDKTVMYETYFIINRNSQLDENNYDPPVPIPGE